MKEERKQNAINAVAVPDPPVNPSRIILQKEVFSRFALTGEIDHLKFVDSHYTDALVAPLKDAPELSIVFMWVDRPFNFSADAGYMEIIPAKCSKDPLNLTDPERVVHLSVTANRCPGRCSSDCKNGVMFTAMEPNIKCRMIADSSSENSPAVLRVASYILRRGHEECQISRAITRKQLTDVKPVQPVPALTMA